MATYKVLQDIEAEDKLLGPLSLRQFIYAVIVVILGFVAWQLTRINIFVAIPMLIPMGFFGLLAAPFGVNQSSEIWLLAKIRYFLFPKKRVWDQAGLEELVTITVPKQIEKHLSDELGQEEVKSRLEALANTLDSRGWALRNQGESSFQATAAYGVATNERLVAIPNLPDQTQIVDAENQDVQDQNTSAVAQQMNQLINTAETEKKQKLQDITGASSLKANSPIDREAINIIRKAKLEYQRGIEIEKRRMAATKAAPSTIAGPKINEIKAEPMKARTKVESPGQETSMTIDHSGGKIEDVAKVEKPKPKVETTKVKTKAAEPKASKSKPTEVSTSKDGEVTISLH